MEKIRFIPEPSYRGSKNPITGRVKLNWIVAVNSKGQKGCLPGETEPYSPLGGKETLLEVLHILVWV